MIPLLSSFIWLPIIGAIGLLLLGNNNRPSSIRIIAFAFSILMLGLSVYLYWQFDPHTAHMQFTENVLWMDALGIRYALGVDGISMPLVLLTAYTHVLVVLAAWRLISDNQKQYYAVFLFIQASINGVFLATDAMLYFVFWLI